MNFLPFITWDSPNFSWEFVLKKEHSILEKLINELFYIVIDFLDLKSLQNLSLTSKAIFNKIYLSGHEKALLIFGKHYLKTAGELLLNKKKYFEQFFYITRTNRLFTQVDYEKLLYKSVIVGNVSVFKSLLDFVKLDKQTMINIYLLAISKKQNEIAYFLKNEGYSCSKPVKLLKYACKNGNIDVLQEQLSEKTNLTFANKRSLFCKAALHGKLEVIRLLIKKFKYKGFFTLLAQAIRDTQLHVVRFYLEKDKEFGFISAELNSARFWSIKLGNLELLEIIDSHIRDKKKAYLFSYFKKLKKKYKSPEKKEIVQYLDYLFDVTFKVLSANHSLRTLEVIKTASCVKQYIPEHI